MQRELECAALHQAEATGDATVVAVRAVIGQQPRSHLAVAQRARLEALGADRLVHVSLIGMHFGVAFRTGDEALRTACLAVGLQTPVLVHA